MKYRSILLLTTWFFIAVSLFAQPLPNSADNLTPDDKSALSGLISPMPAPAVKLDFPIFDLPYQIDAMHTVGNGFFSSYANLSMDQALALTMDLYSAMHFGMKKLYNSLTIRPAFRTAIYYGGTALGLLTFAYLLPFGYTWMDREFTRSILSNAGIDSVNGKYNIINPTGVIGVTDYDLESFKTESPHDMIRMQVAGIEGYTLFADHLLRNVFFYNLDNLSNWTAFIATYIGNVGHLGVGVLANYGFINIDNNIKDIYKNDGDEESRQLYGYDAINWVYDLFRPDEPYSARGIHPSGNGIARYITLAQLTDEENQYLVKQGWLSCLNLFSPLLYGFETIRLGNSGFEGNFALHHYLTSFGSDIPVQVFLKKAPFNMLFTYHNYQNYGHYFPAIEAELVEFPLRLGSKFDLLLSPRVLIGMQPKEQEFKTASPEFLGLAGLRVDFAVAKHFFPYFDVTAKTKGWVAGNEYLQGNTSISLGLSMRF
jgi:hypothetical protein